MAKRRRTRGDEDNPWKEALEHFLRPFLALLFPAVHDAIDWSRGYESLDKELQQLLVQARTGGREGDKLFKVWLTGGGEAWLLIHVEIQGRPERGFPERMFMYGYRIYDRHRRQVVSLAVLCDNSPRWRPDRFEAGALGSSLGIRFLTAKLLDYRGREAELERDPNPFAAIVLAHLKTRETRGAPGERWRWKLRLVKRLYDRGLTAEQDRQLFRLLDWMVQLPEELQQQFDEELHRFEQERRMPYISSLERRLLAKALEKAREEMAEEVRKEVAEEVRKEVAEEVRKEVAEEVREETLEEGHCKGLLESIAMDLEMMYGNAGKKLLPKFQAVHDANQLREHLRALKSSKSLDEVKRLFE